jgi:ubiquinone/menaquinone biosynthesis C-methylase UbiE
MSKNRISSIEAQFELERILRERILSSLKNERNAIVEQAYTELFEKFPDHTQLSTTNKKAIRKGRLKAALIIPLTKRESKILEVGCGRGDAITALAEHGRICTGVEISSDMLHLCEQRGLKVIRGFADHIDIPASSFDVIFSHQMLEHLHPEDVPGHFSEAFRLLRPNGILAVETPNFRVGPQDVSRGFARIAEGLHLKEWSFRELISLFQDAGFVKIRGLMAPLFLARRLMPIHRFCQVPWSVKYISDMFLAIIPTLPLKTIAAKLLGLDDIYLFAKKPYSGQLPQD